MARQGAGRSRLALRLALVTTVLAAAGLTIALARPHEQMPAATGESPSVLAGASGQTATPTRPLGSSIDASTSPTTGATGREVVASRIQVPRLGIDLPIVEGDGIDAPLTKAAHYPGTAWPGAGSNIYIYGHAQEGLFLPLWNAREGDVIVLGLVDGSERRYVVSEVRPRVAYNDHTVIEPTPTEQLTLQTSTSYVATAPRFVIIAVPAS